MAFLDDEKSVADSKPIEIYHFENVTTNEHWRYTSAGVDQTYIDQTYEAVPIQRSNLELTEDTFKNELKIEVARDNPFAEQFILSPVEGIIEITIYRGQDGDYITHWNGAVLAVVFNSNKAEIICTPRTSSMLRLGLRRKFSRICTYPLYGEGCGVQKILYKVEGLIATISDFTITASEFGDKTDGWFIGGKIVVGNAQRLIVGHSGTSITISRRLLDADAGDAFTAYAGCDHTKATCKDKFDNLDEFGGQPWIPDKNPFSGDAIA